MLDFLLYYTPSYLISYGIGYLFLVKLYKDIPLFKYINNKRSRGIISILVIWGIFILISLLVSSFNLSKNTSNIFTGLITGIMVILLLKIKYPENF